MNTLSTVKDITTELEAGIKKLYTSEAYQSYLDTREFNT